MKLSNWFVFGAAALSGVAATTAQAQIYNEATVTGSYGATPVEASDDESVDVAPSAPDLEIVKTASAPDISMGQADRADAGDTITYTFVITNKGNVTMTGVTPVDDGPTFGGQAGTGTLSAFTVNGTSPAEATATLAPDASATFTAVYTLSDLDVYHAADTAALTGAAKSLVANTAAAAGTDPTTTAYEDPDTDEARVELVPFPEIDLVKASSLDDTNNNGFADKDEVITYTYTVTNTGNVPLTGVSVADVHEGANLTSGSDITSEALTSDGPLLASTGATSTDDATADNGIWGTLQPEAVVTFTYVHTVTQTEVDGG